ncbi:MAG: hypothetical protein Q8P12_05190 [bacterium]|nr:hypothetical protein [bacterium]
MAEETAAAAPAQNTQQPEEEAAPQGQSQASFLDPDVLLFALPFAIIIDILDVVLAIGVIANLIIGAPLIFWMVWKTGRIEAAKEQVQAVRENMAQRQAARKVATRRALRRGIFYFIGGLVPVLSIFVLWTRAIVQTVRGK